MYFVPLCNFPGGALAAMAMVIGFGESRVDVGRVEDDWFVLYVFRVNSGGIFASIAEKYDVKKEGDSWTAVPRLEWYERPHDDPRYILGYLQEGCFNHNVGGRLAALGLGHLFESTYDLSWRTIKEAVEKELERRSSNGVGR